MRRMFRRQIRRTLAQEVPPVLQEANFAFDKGEYGRAGELFERIAEAASARGGPRAPMFYLQAGRARVFAGQTALGMPSLKRGLELLSQQRLFRRIQRVKRRLINELRERGLEAEAREVEAWMISPQAGAPEAERQEPQVKRPILPTHCPACGGAVRPDEVEWLDEATAECDYCGSPVRAER
jgi:hypothetical protein